MRRRLSRIAFASIALLLVPTPAWSQHDRLGTVLGHGVGAVVGLVRRA